MARVYADRVKETSTTTGTGTYNLAGAVTGFRTFVAGVATGNTCYYCVTDNTDWEVGLGTVTSGSPDTLARTAILASSNSNAAVSWAAGTKDVFLTIPALGLLPQGHIFGLTMSNAADTVNDITVATGVCRDELDRVDLKLPASITKQLDAGWAVGTNAGGLNTGAKANSTWYEVHLIMRPDTGVVDVMFTTTANRATLPTNYVYQRRIGWIRNNAAPTILQFTQIDDSFTWTTQVNDVSTAPTTTAAAVALTVPPSTIARFRASLQSNAGGTTVADDSIVLVFSEIPEGNVTPALSTGIASLAMSASAVNVAIESAGHFELLVSSTSTIEHDSAITGFGGGSTNTFDISTFGFIDTRERLS